MVGYFIGGIVTGITIAGLVAFVIWARVASKADKAFFADLARRNAEHEAFNDAFEAKIAKWREESGLPARA